MRVDFCGGTGMAQCQCVKTLFRDPVSHKIGWGRLKSGMTFAGTWWGWGMDCGGEEDPEITTKQE